MKIYTRTGDRGETGLFGGGRVRKDDIRVEAYGEVDELNAVLGLAAVPLEGGPAGDLLERLRLLQEDLFAIGAHLATPAAGQSRAAAHLPPLPEIRIEQMERWIDAAEEELEPLRNFVLPGGVEAAARLHVARTVCRRAERRVLALGTEAEIPGSVLVYLNRLSDLLFTMARQVNRAHGREDVPWIGRRARTEPSGPRSGDSPDAER
jgi:cob(I)alamin adenosyltransferase